MRPKWSGSHEHLTDTRKAWYEVQLKNVMARMKESYLKPLRNPRGQMLWMLFFFSVEVIEELTGKSRDKVLESLLLGLGNYLVNIGMTRMSDEEMELGKREIAKFTAQSLKRTALD